MPLNSLSLVIPSLNPPDSFYRTLEDLLDEYKEDIEIIISDGGGLDVSRLPKSKILRWWSEPDSGQAEAINKGILRSNGDIVGYLNTDDYLFPNALNVVKDAFAENPESQLIYGHGIHVDEDGSWLEDYPTQDWDYEALMSDCFLCQPAVFWRKEIHSEFGYFNEKLHYALDYDFWLRLGKRIPFLFLKNKFLAKTQLHALAKTIEHPIPAKWENLLVKQENNEWIDIKSAFEYCGLVSESTAKESLNQARFAKTFLTTMRKIDRRFTVMDKTIWEAARQEMKEMTTISKKNFIYFRKKISILVDLSILQAGGVHGGIKPAIYSLLKEISEARNIHLILLIAPSIKTEIEEIFDNRVTRLICDKDTTSESLNNDCRPDLLFCPLPSIRFYHLSTPLIFLCPDLLHIDYPDALEADDRDYRHSLFIQAREKADLFLTVSRFSRERLIEAYEIPHRKVWVLPHALPHGRTIRQTARKKIQSPYFLYPANFWKHKNHKTLLVAFKIYAAHTKSPWTLKLTGHPDTGNVEAIEKLIRVLDLGNNVEYLGYLTEKEYHQIWANADALVFPSNYEGFGLPLLEAMESRIPILAADIPSLKEVAGSAALYVNQRSPDAIADGLKRISSDESLRKTLVESGKERLKLFNWTEPAETFLALASNLVTQKKSNSK